MRISMASSLPSHASSPGTARRSTDSCGRLRREPCLLPGPKATVKRPHACETAIEKYPRQTGAGGFARSRAVENDLLVGGQRVEVALERARRDAPRSRNHQRRPAERLLVSQIDDQDLGRL